MVFSVQRANFAFTCSTVTSAGTSKTSGTQNSDNTRSRILGRAVDAYLNGSKGPVRGDGVSS